MDTITISAIWRMLTWLPAFILRRIFTKGRLSELILFDLRPRHDPATINLGGVASYELWLQITNISPFLVVLDQASFKFFCGGAVFESVVVEHLQFASGETSGFQIGGPINSGQADQIAQNLNNLNARFEGVMEFNCDLHNFSKSNWSLSGINPRLVNENNRQTPTA